jgi:hypothetical protein
LKTRFTTRWTSLAVIVSLLLSLLPAAPVFAAISIDITNLYVSSTQPTSATTQVDRFTSSPITITADINGIPAEEITNIYYEVKNFNTDPDPTKPGAPVKDNKAVKASDNDNQIWFNNVVLTEGLNQIIIKYGTTGAVASAPGWVFYTPVSNITGLKFNGSDFSNDQVYPSSPPYTNLQIEGLANNATFLEAIVNGQSYAPSVFNNGSFTYVTNTNRINDINFRGGDNVIQFIATNSTNTYQTKRAFVYNDGKPFAYNVKAGVIETPPATQTYPSSLIEEPSFSSSTSAIALQTKIKVNASSGGLDYEFVDVYAEGKRGSEEIVINLLNTSHTITGSNAAVSSLTKDVTSAVYGAATYNLTGIVPINAGTTYQELVFHFYNDPLNKDVNAVKSKYGFYFQNPNEAYIKKVERLYTGGTPVTVSPIGSTQINEFPTELRVYTGIDNTTDYAASHVEVVVNGSIYDDGSGTLTTIAGTRAYPVDNSAGRGYATIVLKDIPDGAATLTITPITQSLSPVSHALTPSGLRDYQLNISSVPFVNLVQITNGMVITGASKLTCENGDTGPCVAGRIGNLTINDTSTATIANSIKVFVGGQQVFIHPDRIDPATGTFLLNGNDLSGKFTTDGKHTLKFELYMNGIKVTEAKYDIFVFSSSVPVIDIFRPREPDAANPVFISATTPGSYVTRANQVQVEADVPYATSASITIRYKDAKGNPLTRVLSTGSAPPNELTIVGNKLSPAPTIAFPLENYGDYIFELNASNATGVTVIRTITITKEPVPYRIEQPKGFIKNAKGIDQANINKNYQKIIIVADNADSVMLGKNLMTYNKAQNWYEYEATNLKVGENKFDFTVTRGTAELEGTFILNNVNSMIEGAQYKQPLASKMKIFNGDIEIEFPKDTKLMRNDRNASNQFITSQRNILFGIANNNDGRVDKDIETPSGRMFLVPPGHFRPASKKFWIDAGSVSPFTGTDPNYQLKLENALKGSGELPNDSSLTSFGTNKPAFFARNLKDQIIPTQRGTLTLKYDSTIRNDSWKYLTVYQFGVFEDNHGLGTQYAGWKNIGGIVDPKKNTISVPIDSFGYFQVMYMDDSFPDVTLHQWARDDIETLFSKGLMNEKTAVRFMTEDPVSRGEFASMLVDIFEIPLDNPDTALDPASGYSRDTFTDVVRGRVLPNSNNGKLFDYKHIEAAARAGIVRGTDRGLFLPANPITREDAAIMIARAAELKLSTDIKKSEAALQKIFTDANAINDYALTAVEAVNKAGLIEGKANVLLEAQKKATVRFDPKENMTRAEAAAIAIRVLKQQKKIPK